MKPTDTPRTAQHEEAVLALSWLANGTLEPEEAAAVEAHLAVCAQCRDELARERRLCDELRTAAAVSPAPHPVHLARLWQRIDRETGSTAIASPGRLEGLRRAFSGWPPSARRLAAAQAAALLLLALLLVGADRPRPAGFHTLAAQGAPPASARLRVVFVDSLDQRGLRELLLPLGAEIVAGPSPLGVYTLALPADAEPLGWVLAHLRARPEVRFAEPVPDKSEP